MNEGLVVLVRSLIGFFTLLIFARLLGKQQISQLTFFDYVLGITIGSIAASLSVDLTTRAWPHWVGLITWAVTVLALQFITIRWNKADTILTGEPVVVIMNGMVMEESMKKTRYTLSDLLEQLRDKGVFDLTRVQFAVLETNGQLSVLLKPEYAPATPSDLNLTVQSSGLSTELIYNGIIIDENLQKAGVDRFWLIKQLNTQGISNPSEVFIAAYNPASSTLFIDKYKDYSV
ncbi:MAG: DUF421 domain-containing protein [Syntrophomonadaceae bacterium]|nr:DUF421 domain-containing protein [Syntrophomonadaceae bacterium]MDD3890103.1 DUF421 domain-containing protein [Syntrophomonadaceae bacterium]